MFFCKHPNRAKEMAKQLKELNDERKELTLKGLEEATETIERELARKENQEMDKVLIVYLPTCHESLAGSIAGRIKERYH